MLGVGVVGWVTLRSSKPEPLYQGKPVSYWIGKLGVDSRRQPNPTAPPDFSAWEAFSRTDRDAVPFLIAASEAREPLHLRMYRTVHRHLPRKLARKLPEPSDATFSARSMALGALGAMGTNALPAVPTIIRILDDKDHVMKFGAVRALQQIGPSARKAVPSLVRALGAPTSSLHLELIAALEAIAPADERFLAALPVLLSNSYAKEIRLRAAEVLVEHRLRPSDLSAALLSVVRDGDIQMRWSAVRSLGHSKVGGQAAVEALAECLGHEDNRVRGAAATALGEFGFAARTAEPALRNAFNDEFSNVREAAQEALKKIAGEGTQ